MYDANYGFVYPQDNRQSNACPKCPSFLPERDQLCGMNNQTRQPLCWNAQHCQKSKRVLTVVELDHYIIVLLITVRKSDCSSCLWLTYLRLLLGWYLRFIDETALVLISPFRIPITIVLIVAMKYSCSATRFKRVFRCLPFLFNHLTGVVM